MGVVSSRNYHCLPPSPRCFKWLNGWVNIEKKNVNTICTLDWLERYSHEKVALMATYSLSIHQTAECVIGEQRHLQCYGEYRTVELDMSVRQQVARLVVAGRELARQSLEEQAIQLMTWQLHPVCAFSLSSLRLRGGKICKQYNMLEWLLR